MAAHHSAQRTGAALRLSAAALLLLVAAAAGAQSGRLSTPVCLFLPDPAAGEGHTVRLIMDAELNAELRRLGLPVVPEAAWRALLPADSAPPWEAPPVALRLAAQMEAAVVVIGTFRLQRTLVELAVRAYEVSTGATICEIEQSSGRDIGVYNQVAALARDVGSGLQAWLESPPAVRAAVGAVKPATAGEGQRPAEPRTPLSPTPPVSVRVTLLSSDEGAEVWLDRQSLAGTVIDGKLLLEVPVNSLLRIEKRKPGYHADREELPVAEDPVEVPLRPLQRSTRWAVELFYSSSQFLGLGTGLRLYLVPDYLALTAGHYSYFSLDPGSGGGESAYHGDFRLTAGSYLLAAPEARLRFGLATGMGAILSVFGISAGPAERETYADLYWEILDAWLELNWKHFAVFLRAETRYALGLDGGVLERGFVSDYGPQYSLGWLIKL